MASSNCYARLPGLDIVPTFLVTLYVLIRNISMLNRARVMLELSRAVSDGPSLTARTRGKVPKVYGTIASEVCRTDKPD